MRPTKLLTISAIAGLSLISYGHSAHAAPVPVTLTGSVASSCTLAVGDGSLSGDIEPALFISATGGDRGTVVVTCNDSTKSLRLAIDSRASVLYNGIGKIRTNGAGGVFGTRNTPTSQPGLDPIVLALTSPTKAAGDTVRVQARIDAPAGQLLRAASDYNLVVTATITP
jgi:hypothetical protein